MINNILIKFNFNFWTVKKKKRKGEKKRNIVLLILLLIRNQCHEYQKYN